MHFLEAHLTASLVSLLNIEGTRDTLIHDPVTITQSWLEETAERFTNQVVAVPTDEDSTDTDHIQMPPFFANLKADFSKWLAYIVTYSKTVNSSGKPGQGRQLTWLWSTTTL